MGTHARSRWRRLALGAPRLALELLRPGKHRHRARARLAALRTALVWRARKAWLRRPLVAISLVDHLGDVVAAEPILRAVRRRWPQAHVVWVARRPWRSLLAHHPDLDAVVVVPCLTAWMFLRDAGVFDEIVDLQIEGRACDTCWWPYERRDGRRDVTVANYYAHGNLLGIFCRVAELPVLDETPLVAPSPAAVERVDRLALPERYVAIHAQSRQDARNWQEERWSELVRRLAGEHDVDVVELGIVPARRSRSPRYRDLAGALDPAETAEVLRRARLFIGVDSGPAHLANAVGTPGVVLLGRYRSYASYMPFSGAYGDGSNADVIQADGPAATIELERVLAGARRFLAPAPQSPHPLVSVVVPTYGHAHLVGATLESVFAQTYAPFEVVVVDDGSPDDTRGALEPWIASGRIRYVRQENAGQGAARNRGVAESRGEYIALLDDDDLWPPDKLARQVAALRDDRRALLAYGEHVTLFPDGRTLAHDYGGHPDGWCASAFLRGNWIHSPGQTLIARAALERIGGFDGSFAGSDDWDLYLRLAREGRFVRVPGVALLVREHEANASRDAVQHARDHFRVMRKHMRGRPLLMLRHLHRASTYFVPNLARMAARARGERAYGRALRASVYSLCFRPSLLVRPRFLASVAASLLHVPSRR